ncbi:hypothetical protein PG990_012828 [Apiospora arundinis]
MARCLSSQWISRLGVALLALLLFLYATSNTTDNPIVNDLPGHAIAPEHSLPLGQNEVRDSQPIAGHGEQDHLDLATSTDLVSKILPALQPDSANALSSLEKPLTTLMYNVVDLSSLLAMVSEISSIALGVLTITSTARTSEPTRGLTNTLNRVTTLLPSEFPISDASATAVDEATDAATVVADQAQAVVSQIVSLESQAAQIISPTPRPIEGMVVGGSWMGSGSRHLLSGGPAAATAYPGGKKAKIIYATCNCPLQPCCPQTTTAPDGQASGSGPCPGSGYTCDDCIDGWFCPPPQTPAQTGPNGCFGWACADCRSGWFCIPNPTNNCPSTSSMTVPNLPTAASPPYSLLSTTTVTVQLAEPTPTIQNNASGWVYAGCWADQPHQPVLGEVININFGRPLTNEICVRHCLVSGYTLAATSFGDRCLCGQFLNGTQRLDDASQCATPCAGDETHVCGGDWAWSCYSPDGQARGWAQIGSEQPNPEVLDPPTVLSLAVGGVGVTVVTVPTTIFPTSGANLSQLQSQYGQYTQRPKAVLPSGVGQSPYGSYGSSTDQAYGGVGGGGGSDSKQCCPNTSQGPNVGYGDSTATVCTGGSSTHFTVPCIGSNPTLTLTPGASGITTAPTPTGWNSSAVAPDSAGNGGVVPRGDRPATITSDPTGNAYIWPSGVVPHSEGPPVTTLAQVLSLEAANTARAPGEIAAQERDLLRRDGSQMVHTALPSLRWVRGRRTHG